MHVIAMHSAEEREGGLRTKAYTHPQGWLPEKAQQGAGEGGSGGITQAPLGQHGRSRAPGWQGLVLEGKHLGHDGAQRLHQGTQPPGVPYKHLHPQLGFEVQLVGVYVMQVAAIETL